MIDQKAGFLGQINELNPPSFSQIVQPNNLSLGFHNVFRARKLEFDRKNLVFLKRLNALECHSRFADVDGKSAIVRPKIGVCERFDSVPHGTSFVGIPVGGLGSSWNGKHAVIPRGTSPEYDQNVCI